jgi:hypothetical protein
MPSSAFTLLTCAHEISVREHVRVATTNLFYIFIRDRRLECSTARIWSEMLNGKQGALLTAHISVQHEQQVSGELNAVRTLQIS